MMIKDTATVEKPKNMYTWTNPSWVKLLLILMT